jgi:hypothetical protein
MSTAQCIGGNGGAFDEKQSSTWVSEPLSDDTVEDPLFSVDSSNNLEDEFGTDTLHLTDSTSVSRFPFHIPRFTDDSTVHRNNLGLGPESTLLSQLHKAGKIASQSWSLFWGDGSHGANGRQPHPRRLRCCKGSRSGIHTADLEKWPVRWWTHSHGYQHHDERQRDFYGCPRFITYANVYSYRL